MVIPNGLSPHSLSLCLFLYLFIPPSAVEHADDWINCWLIESEWLSFAVIFNTLFTNQEVAICINSLPCKSCCHMLYYMLCSVSLQLLLNYCCGPHKRNHNFLCDQAGLYVDIQSVIYQSMMVINTYLSNVSITIIWQFNQSHFNKCN